MRIRILPREHGAYAQLGVPLVVALAAGRPGVAAFAFAVGAIALFFVHEPLLSLAAELGGRARATARAARRLEHNLAGELVLSSLLAGAAAPAAMAAGVAPGLALWMWAAWAAGFGVVTCAVHASVSRRARHGRDDAGAARVVGPVLAVAAGILVAVQPVPVIAVLPMVVAAVGISVARPSARQLRRVGWTLMAATLVAGVWMAIATRAAG